MKPALRLCDKSVTVFSGFRHTSVTRKADSSCTRVSRGMILLYTREASCHEGIGDPFPDGTLVWKHFIKE